MKRAVVILLALLMCLGLACCGSTETVTDATYMPKQKAEITINNETEQFILATVKEANGDSLTLVTDEGQEYIFSFSENVKVVEGEYYLPAVKASDLVGKKVSAIVGKEVQETWPMGLTNERLIILAE